jgi:DNA-directed RNA polymerase sigma subunit (sigma70/sigma32)
MKVAQVHIDKLSIFGHVKGILSGYLRMIRHNRRSLERIANSNKISTNLSEQTKKVLSTLAPREEMILRMRFGIGRRAGNLEDLSRQFSLTYERIRQIEVEALRKVRQRTRSFYSKASFGTFIRVSDETK